MHHRTTRTRLRRLAVCAVAVPGLVLGSAITATAAPGVIGSGPLAVSDAVRAATTQTGIVAPALRAATGTVRVSVRLSEVPLAASVSEDAVATDSLPSASVQRTRTAAVRAQQDRFVAQAQRLGAQPTARAVLAVNVVTVQIDAARVAELARLAGVVSVTPVAKYETHADPAAASGSLAQAAEYLDVTPSWDAGFDGTGVRIAVLDSGADYTHANLGGPGSVRVYNNCYAQRDVAPTGRCARLFGPGAPKVVGGYDFVGETWNGSTVPDLAPDPNPIDHEGHGTHVSDIAAGNNPEDTHRGIAFGADVVAIKVCSAVSSACSGEAILQGIDFALDPNGDGDISDAVNVMNLSLGSSYGQAQDDSALALDNAVRAGVVVVASAGNSADRPFIVGSPSTAARVISVAQTALPDDVLYPIVVTSPVIPGLPDNTVKFSVLQSWGAPLAAPVTGPLGQPVDNLGCEASDFAAFPAGAVALIQRGVCNASLKAQNAQAAGASTAVIWNNVPGDPPTFSFGGGEPVTIPVLTISQANGLLLSAADDAGTVNVVIDPAAAIALANTVVGTTSRGPRIQDGTVKPDIGAPGAWLSAEVGTGREETNFGGTSGAAPVVSGAAALLIDRYPNSAPVAVKSRLLNGASTENQTPDTNANFYPTPITRVGAGELRVAPSSEAAGILINRQVGNGNIGLGLPRLSTTQTYSVRLSVFNTGLRSTTYALEPTFRDPADAAGVTVDVPDTVTVPGGRARDVTFSVRIDPSKLTPWPFAGTAGFTGDGSALNAPEIDGFVIATAPTETLHLGWQVLPRRSSDVTTAARVPLRANGTAVVTLSNASQVQDGVANVYGLTGTSPRQPLPRPGDPGSPGSNAVVVDLEAAGVRDDVATDLLQFAMAGRDRQAVTLYPAGYEVDIDTNADGEPDYAVFQQEQTGFAATGVSLVFVLDIATGVATSYYFTVADFDSSTQVLSVPLSALGLSRGETFDFTVLAFDNYFSGLVTDVIDGMSWTVGKPLYSLAGGADTVVVPSGRSTRLTVNASATAGPSSQSGLLMLLDNNKSTDFQAVTITP